MRFNLSLTLAIMVLAFAVFVNSTELGENSVLIARQLTDSFAGRFLRRGNNNKKVWQQVRRKVKITRTQRIVTWKSKKVTIGKASFLAKKEVVENHEVKTPCNRRRCRKKWVRDNLSLEAYILVLKRPQSEYDLKVDRKSL
eukprot:CAMPEP_0203789760 /NCGR_PEP_ID=MMETSP0100_2-20121128/3647_1 /ASSEMBLY_ACC=CAM_ASM_000210 /TAXON_ID=96639 /ORGANISM=" , Strain NY0313808BC1" /LENGTH=140 /DNA_ID=CAMNT_0050692781 /DNA_START=23 /DNA_END=442 /DNA_ORIENTATION=+